MIILVNREIGFIVCYSQNKGQSWPILYILFLAVTKFLDLVAASCDLEGVNKL